jgi:broad specificity phosphatase PhoE
VAELVLVRHAQASFHAADYDRLSDLGHSQSRWLGEWFAMRRLRFDAMVTGTLNRHHQTLSGVCEGIGLASGTLPIELPGLDEYHFRAIVPAYESVEPHHPLVLARQAAPADKAAFYRVLRLALRAWAEDALPGPLPESWSEFRSRVEEAASELQRLSERHARILAISSGGAMAALFGGRFGLDVEQIVDVNLQIRNTSVSHFYLNRERFLLASWNAVPHLELAGRGDVITYG